MLSERPGGEGPAEQAPAPLVPERSRSVAIALKKRGRSHPSGIRPHDRAGRGRPRPVVSRARSRCGKRSRSTSTRRCSQATWWPSCAPPRRHRHAAAVHDRSAAAPPGGRSRAVGLPQPATASGSSRPISPPDTGGRRRGRQRLPATLRDAMASVGSLGALEYIARGVAELPGRKCIVFFSEGFGGMFKDRERERPHVARDVAHARPCERRRRRRLHDRRARARDRRAARRRTTRSRSRRAIAGTYDAGSARAGPRQRDRLQGPARLAGIAAVHRRPDRRPRHHEHERSQSRASAACSRTRRAITCSGTRRPRARRAAAGTRTASRCA